MANGATAALEITVPGLRDSDSKTGFQKRIDKITREKYELRQVKQKLLQKKLASISPR